MTSGWAYLWTPPDSSPWVGEARVQTRMGWGPLPGWKPEPLTQVGCQRWGTQPTADGRAWAGIRLIPGEWWALSVSGPRAGLSEGREGWGVLNFLLPPVPASQPRLEALTETRLLLELFCHWCLPFSWRLSSRSD